MTGSSFLSIIIPGELFAPLFKEKKLAAKNLSRTTEDSGTVIVPLVPWSMAAVFMSGTLGVPTLEYLPWTFMNYLGFLFALFYGYTGMTIAPRKREDETLPGS
jgi:NhaC family Na+:H+ antiporter